MASKKYQQIRKTAAEKRQLVLEWLKENPELSNSDLIRMLKEQFGSSMEAKHFTDARKALGLDKRKKTITKEDVIVLQKCCDIPDDMREVLQYTVEYMRDVGIKHLELDEDGSVSLKLTQELETTV
jgi:hypothetical protein